MVLKVIGSGSSGNTYLLENETECLVIEAGLPFMEVKKALDFNIRKIRSVIVTHEHGDHHKYWYQYVTNGIPVYEPFKNEGQTLYFDDSEFVVKAFDLVHDVPCYGFYITHPDIGKLVYASDTEYIKYKFKNVNHFLVEANYSMDFVDKDKPNYEHVLQGHMSIDTACEFLKANNNPYLEHVILCHLSNVNSCSEDFINKAKKVVDCPVYVAEKGLEVELNLLPF